jgi:transcriptional regulator with XRE-family HTH domain
MDWMSLRRTLIKQCQQSTQRAVARRYGISAQYLSDVMQGRRAPGEKLLKALGLRKRISYTKETR